MSIIMVLFLFQISVIQADESVNITDKVQKVLKDQKEMQVAKDKEAMRDKSHDNRIEVNNNTSLGVDKNGVNIKKTY